MLVHVDAEVVGKKGMCHLCGIVGGYVANQRNRRGRNVGIVICCTVLKLKGR
jgi:hypothetical protein